VRFRTSRVVRPRRLFRPAPSIAAVLVLLVGSVLPGTPPQAAGGTREATSATTTPTPVDEPPASVTEVPSPNPAPPATPPTPAGAADSQQVLTASNPWSVPEVLLAAYRQAVAGSPPACHLPVSLLAAIGQVESASLAGRSIDSAHRAVPPVLGPVLDGAGTAAIPDTDGGRLDGNSRWDRAVGPMQFIPSTWATYGIDGDGDGRADPQNVYDATASAAGYLCAGGRDLALASGLRSAILSYNHSTAYLTTVLSWQQRFSLTGGGTIGTVVNTINGSGANASGTLTAQSPAPATPSRAISSAAAAAIRKGSPPLTPVVVRTAAKLAFTTAASPATTSGIAFSTQPVVTVQDEAGNTVTTDTSSVTLTMTNPAGATLRCDSNPEVARLGIASFTGCTIDKAGTYLLTATAGSLDGSTTSLTVTAGAAAKLAFTAAPSFAATSGTALDTQPTVTVQDEAGNTVTTDTSSVTLTLSDPAGATLTCDSDTASAVDGMASFNGCAIDKTGTYKLTATAGSLTAATSTSVTIYPGVPAAITATLGSGQSAVVGRAFASPLIARVTDAHANPVPDVTVAFTAPNTPNDASGTFAGPARATTAVTDSEGRATSGVLTANTTSGTFSLIATTASVRATFTLTNAPGAATTFAITSAPVEGTASAKATLGPITVQIQDLYGNPVAAPSGGTDVTLASDSSGTCVFATTLEGTSVTSVLIPTGKSSATFYYGDSAPGSPVITASGLLTSATQKETVLAAPTPTTTTAASTGP
jgi:hypothetical protein